MADVPYGITLSTFYTGHTGMRLQMMGTPGKDALILGGFLTVNEWANMIGLYELSPSKLTRCLPSVKGKALTKAFELLATESYAYYDEPTEFVWVREMARVRLRLQAGKILANENALKGARNLYQRLPLNPFLGPFYDRYHVELDLKHRRQGPSNGVRTASEGPSNGVRRGLGTASEVSSADQVPVRSTSVQAVLSTQKAVDQGISTQEEQPTLTRRNFHRSPADFQTLCALATEVLNRDGADIEELGDYKKRIEELARARQRTYELDALRNASAAALTAFQKRHPHFKFRFDVVAAAEPEQRIEPSDPTLRVGRMRATPVPADGDLVPVDGGPAGSSASVADLATSLKADNVEDFKARMKQAFGGGPRRG